MNENGQPKCVVYGYVYETFTRGGGFDVLSVDGIMRVLNAGYEKHPHLILEQEDGRQESNAIPDETK